MFLACLYVQPSQLNPPGARAGARKRALFWKIREERFHYCSKTLSATLYANTKQNITMFEMMVDGGRIACPRKAAQKAADRRAKTS